MNLLNSIIPTLRREADGRPETVAGQTDLGPTVAPRYEINETAEAFGLVVELPGVAKAGLEITAEEGRLRVVGRRAWKRPEAWTTMHRETSEATFLLELTHDNAINLHKVQAELRDGVLRVSLPKTEALKPRKIAVA